MKYLVLGAFAVSIVASCGGDSSPGRQIQDDETDDVDAAASGGRGGPATGGRGGGGGTQGTGGGGGTKDAGGTGGAGGSSLDASMATADASVDAATGMDTSAGSMDTAAPGDAGAGTLGSRYCPANVTSGNPLPPAGMRQARRIQFQPAFTTGFTEGALWLSDPGVLLFSDFTGPGRIVQLTPPAMASVFIPGSGTNGLALAPDGNSLIVADQQARAIARYALPGKARTVIADRFNGQSFKPNDVVVRADGTIYFTDLDAGRLYRIAPGGQVSQLATGGANGVSLSPDEKTLYLNGGGRLRKFAVNPDGTVGQGSDFAQNIAGPDGMAIDCAGNVYAAQYSGGSVAVFSPGGQRFGEITVANGTTNAAFGGPDRKTLYITAGNNGVYSIDLAVPGLPY